MTSRLQPASPAGAVYHPRTLRGRNIAVVPSLGVLLGAWLVLVVARLTLISNEEQFNKEMTQWIPFSNSRAQIRAHQGALLLTSLAYIAVS